MVVEEVCVTSTPVTTGRALWRVVGVPSGSPRGSAPWNV